MRCLPAQCVLEFFLAGDQHGGITGAPRTQFARNFASGDVLRYLDYFEDGKATAIADIESFAANAADFLQRANVGIGDVQHMDVVADASSIRGRVVRTEDIDIRQAAGSGVENPGNEMRFHAMMLPAISRGAGGVEIPEADIFKTGISLVIRENLFE